MKGYVDITSSDNDTFSRTDTTIFTKVLVVPILNTQVVMPVDKNMTLIDRVVLTKTENDDFNVKESTSRLAFLNYHGLAQRPQCN